MSVEIISHVFSETLPQYASFLRAQLSSLVLDSLETDVTVSICHAKSDSRVIDILDEFKSHLNGSLIPLSMEKKDLFRRSIGRNIAGLASFADIIWFADVDHFFGPDCLTHLEKTWNGFEIKPVMVYPRKVFVQGDYQIADQFWQEHLESKNIISPNPKDFIVKEYTKAIGGVQIVSGDYVRDHGYLNEYQRWRNPTDGLKPFPDFRDDVKFRRVCATFGEIKQIDLPHLYRLRHSAVTYK